MRRSWCWGIGVGLVLIPSALMVRPESKRDPYAFLGPLGLKSVFRSQGTRSISLKNWEAQWVRYWPITGSYNEFARQFETTVTRQPAWGPVQRMSNGPLLWESTKGPRLQMFLAKGMPKYVSVYLPPGTTGCLETWEPRRVPLGEQLSDLWHRIVR